MKLKTVRWKIGPSQGFALRHYRDSYSETRTLCGNRLPSSKVLMEDDGEVECLRCVEHPRRFEKDDE